MGENVLFLVVGFVAGGAVASAVWLLAGVLKKKKGMAQQRESEQAMQSVNELLAEADTIEANFRSGMLAVENFRRNLGDKSSAIMRTLRTNMHILDVFFVKYAEQEAREYLRIAESPERRKTDSVPAPSLEEVTGGPLDDRPLDTRTFHAFALGESATAFALGKKALTDIPYVLDDRPLDTRTIDAFNFGESAAAFALGTPPAPLPVQSDDDFFIPTSKPKVQKMPEAKEPADFADEFEPLVKEPKKIEVVTEAAPPVAPAIPPAPTVEAVVDIEVIAEAAKSAESVKPVAEAKAVAETHAAPPVPVPVSPPAPAASISNDDDFEADFELAAPAAPAAAPISEIKPAQAPAPAPAPVPIPAPMPTPAPAKAEDDEVWTEESIEEFEAAIAHFDEDPQTPSAAQPVPLPPAPAPAAAAQESVETGNFPLTDVLEDFETPTMEIPVSAVASMITPPPAPAVAATPATAAAGITGDDVIDTIDNMFNLK